MISHGNYRTVYANLKDVYVEKGDEVTTKEVLGALLPSENGNFSEAHLEIWKISTGNMDTVDPSLWIYR
jgi:murein DD-endopeptidase MepM/ murein hydrolase activator NlpD